LNRHQIKTEWLTKRSAPITEAKDDASIPDKARKKRKRNRTVDYAELPSAGSADVWSATVAGYSQRKFEPEPVFSTELSNKVK
jgi:hypothetical protein